MYHKKESVLSDFSWGRKRRSKRIPDPASPRFLCFQGIFFSLSVFLVHNVKSDVSRYLKPVLSPLTSMSPLALLSQLQGQVTVP